MRLLFVLGILGFTACVEHTPPVEKIAVNEDQLVDSLQQKAYKKTQIFAGTIPCADCGGIEQQLILKGDSAGIYQLRETYLQATEDGDEVLISSGEWIRQKKGSEEIYYLSEHNLHDSIRVIRYKVHPNRLSQLDLAVNPSLSGAYTLRLKARN